MNLTKWGILLTKIDECPAEIDNNPATWGQVSQVGELI
jgi:hypothetical protein